MIADLWIGMSLGFALGAVFMFCLAIWLHSGGSDE